MAENVLGLLFEISADPSKAEAALERLRLAHGSTLGQISAAQAAFGGRLAGETDRFVAGTMRAAATSASLGQVLREQLIPGVSAAGETLRNFRETGVQAFADVSGAMGHSITAAIVFSKSFGDAMARALKASLASLAAEALARAIFETGMGFASLAHFDFRSAALWFQAAAVHGTIGGVVAGLSAAIPGGGSGRFAGGGAGLHGRAGGSVETPQRGVSTAAGPVQLAAGAASALGRDGSPSRLYGGNVTIIVGGDAHLAPIIANILNQHVVQNDGRLISSATRRPAPSSR